MINSHIEAVLIVTGLYTAGALVQFVAPRRFLKVTFGADSDDALTLLLAQHWALLAALVGGLLVYAAYHPVLRVPALVIATVEKLGLAGLVFFGRWPRTPAGTRLAVADIVMAVIFILYFVGL
jgi:hypothetical protein